MGGPLFITLADIHMIQMGTDAVVSILPLFYKWYIDDIYNRCQKNTADKLYDGLNNYHPEVKLIIEANPLRFLDTEIIHNNGLIETRIHRKKTKLTTPSISNITKKNKLNTIKAELYRAKLIRSNFTNDVNLIRTKFKSAGCPMRFVNTAIHEFTTAQTNEEIEFIISHWLFEAKKKIDLVEIPSFLKNESSPKQFIKKFEKFTNDTFDVWIK